MASVKVLRDALQLDRKHKCAAMTRAVKAAIIKEVQMRRLGRKHTLTEVVPGGFVPKQPKRSKGF
jgi:hypothetical protein